MSIRRLATFNSVVLNEGLFWTCIGYCINNIITQVRLFSILYQSMVAITNLINTIIMLHVVTRSQLLVFRLPVVCYVHELTYALCIQVIK